MKKQSSLSQLMGYAGEFKILTYLSWFFSCLSALVGFLPFVYIWKIIKEILEVAPNFSAATDLIKNGWTAFLFAVLAMILYVCGLMCSHMSAFRVASNIRKKLTHHILDLPLNFVDDFGSGNLRKIINESSGAAETYLAHNLPDRFVAVASFLGLVFLLLFFDWRLGLISLLPIVLAFLIMSLMTGKSVKDGMQQYNDALADMSNEAVEYVRGIAVVKTFGQTVFSLKRFTKSIDNYQKFVIAYTKHFCAPMVEYTTIINSIFAFLLFAGAVFTRGGVTPEFILSFAFYLIITPLTSVTLSKIMYSSQNKLVVDDALMRINTVLDKEPLVQLDSNEQPKDNSIQLNNVSYSYNGSNLAVNDVSLSIKDGAKIAFVGESGSGKSTLANLIARFFDPQKGEILIGGVDVKDIPKEDLMERVSFVFQRNVLMKASILDNVRMGRPSASDEEVMAALKAAQCSDIVEKLPDGMYTQYGTAGSYLSGGEIQRIIIARAILKNSPILILDEATAFADADNEARIQEALNELSKNKTVIMIAHRLSTVINVDEIYVLGHGKVIESGSPNELRENGGIFEKMWEEYETAISWKV